MFPKWVIAERADGQWPDVRRFSSHADAIAGMQRAQDLGVYSNIYLTDTVTEWRPQK